MEGLERLRTKFTIDLHPSKLASAAEGVRSHLSSLLLRYNEDLEGVLLSYRNERVLTQQASIHPYFPYVRLEVLAEVVLFKPRQGMRIVGTVNKVGADYLGLLVLGFINVSIGADHIRTEFRPCLAEQCWVSSKAPAHRLETGCKVHFTVHAMHHGQFVSIAGSLQQAGTGAEGFAKQPKGKAKAKAAPTAIAAARPAAALARPQQQQQEQTQQEEQQQQQPLETKKGQKKNKKDKAQQQVAAAAPPPAQQQQQAAAAPQQQQQQQQRDKQAEQQAAGNKSKKAKQKQQHAAAAAAPAQNGGGAAAPPSAAAASVGGGKKKDKKRKAEALTAAPTPAAAAAVPAVAAAEANGGGSVEHKTKKKRKNKE